MITLSCASATSYDCAVAGSGRSRGPHRNPPAIPGRFMQGTRRAELSGFGNRRYVIATECVKRALGNPR